MSPTKHEARIQRRGEGRRCEARTKELKAAQEGEGGHSRSARQDEKPATIGCISAKRIDAIVRKTKPRKLIPKTWYGMPAYANSDGKTVCLLQGLREVQESRYLEGLGFNDKREPRRRCNVADRLMR